MPNLVERRLEEMGFRYVPSRNEWRLPHPEDPTKDWIAIDRRMLYDIDERVLDGILKRCRRYVDDYLAYKLRLRRLHRHERSMEQ